MALKPWAWAAIGGGVGAGLVFVFLLPGKVSELAAIADRAKADIAAGRGSVPLAAHANAMKARLETYANEYAEQTANRAADDHLARTYGLSQDRINRMKALATRLGIGGGSSS